MVITCRIICACKWLHCKTNTYTSAWIPPKHRIKLCIVLLWIMLQQITLLGYQTSVTTLPLPTLWHLGCCQFLFQPDPAQCLAVKPDLVLEWSKPKVHHFFIYLLLQDIKFFTMCFRAVRHPTGQMLPSCFLNLWCNPQRVLLCKSCLNIHSSFHPIRLEQVQRN